MMTSQATGMTLLLLEFWGNNGMMAKCGQSHFLPYEYVATIDTFILASILGKQYFDVE